MEHKTQSENVDAKGREIHVGDIVQEDGCDRVGRVIVIHDGALILRSFGGQQCSPEPQSIAWNCHQCTILIDDTAGGVSSAMKESPGVNEYNRRITELAGPGAEELR